MRRSNNAGASNRRCIPPIKRPRAVFNAVLGQRVFVELIAPQLALGIASNVSVYAQTDAGRQAAGGSGWFRYQRAGDRSCWMERSMTH